MAALIGLDSTSSGFDPGLQDPPITFGVWGDSGDADGVIGSSNTGVGVFGRSIDAAATAVKGSSENGTGVEATSARGTAVHARRDPGGGAAVTEAFLATPGLAADFRGDVATTGNVGMGTTEPTHPLHVAKVGGIRQNELYLSGARGWSSVSYNAFHDEANSAWVFPDPSRPAVTVEMDDKDGKQRFEVLSTTRENPTGWVQRLAVDGQGGVVSIPHGQLSVTNDKPAAEFGVANAVCAISRNGTGVDATSAGGTALHARCDPGGGAAVTEAFLATPSLAADFRGDVATTGAVRVGGRLGQSPAAELRARPGGGAELNVVPEAGSPRPVLSVDGAGRNIAIAPQGGNIGVGIDVGQARRTLHVEGNGIHSGGREGGFSFADRTNNGGSFELEPRNGERWVWYAQDGSARLSSDGDHLVLDNAGNIQIGGNIQTAGDMQLERNGSPKLAIRSRGNGTQHYSLRATNDADAAGGRRFVIRNESAGRDDLVLNSAGNIQIAGNIRAANIGLTNADCAEDFDICETEQVEPGTVMVVGEEGVLYPSQQAYDKRVAGVISGAGDYTPGIVLNKQQSSNARKPIALFGKVFCKVNAQDGAIEVGDLLTTSPMPGHAMKADDPLQAFGTVIGKALRSLKEGQGLIPILIALQ